MGGGVDLLSPPSTGLRQPFLRLRWAGYVHRCDAPGYALGVSEAGAPRDVLAGLPQVACFKGDYSLISSPLPGLVAVDPSAKVRLHAVSVDTSVFGVRDVLSVPRGDNGAHINPAEQFWENSVRSNFGKRRILLAGELAIESELGAPGDDRATFPPIYI